MQTFDLYSVMSLLKLGVSENSVINKNLNFDMNNNNNYFTQIIYYTFQMNEKNY